MLCYFDVATWARYCRITQEEPLHPSLSKNTLRTLKHFLEHILEFLPKTRAQLQMVALFSSQCLLQNAQTAFHLQLYRTLKYFILFVRVILVIIHSFNLHPWKHDIIW